MSHFLDHSLPILSDYWSCTDFTSTQPLHILIGHRNTTPQWLCRPWTHPLMELLESILVIIHQMSHILEHSLPRLGEYRSSTDLQCTQPLHILMGQSNTTTWWLCSPWTHPLMEFLESILLNIHQMMSHILEHSLPILGDYRSCTDLKCTQPLHILIGQTNTTMWWLCSPWTHTLMDKRQFFGGSIPAQVYQIWDHSLPILNDRSSSTEVWYSQPLQKPITENTTTNPLQCSP